MSYIDDREQFFNPDEDTAMPPGMTAQYLNECVLKHNGMEVVDNDGDVWGWVHDCHKGVGKWVAATTHDRRVDQMSEGMGQPDLLRDYEPYQYITEHPAPTSDPVNPDHYQGFSNGAEVIDITENLTFSAGNAVKYLSRAGRIDGQNKGAILEDLRKAAWYVAREIDRIEAQE